MLNTRDRPDRDDATAAVRGGAEPLRLGVDELPAHIKTRYRRFALVTRRDQVNTLDADDSDTLIVSCDWLLWRILVAEDRHCVHYELGLVDWDLPPSKVYDLLIHANQWIYRRGEDLTMFRGASLGKLFGAEMSMCLMNYYRLDGSLRRLVARFRPQEILFFDYANDFSFIERELRKRIVETAARESDVAFTDLGGEQTGGVGHMSEDPAAWRRQTLLVRALLFVYTRILEWGTLLRVLFADSRRRVLVLLNSHMLSPLIESFDGGGLTPVFMARSVPKKVGVLWRCFRTGALLVTPRRVGLTADDRARIEAIERSLDQAISEPADGAVGFLRAVAGGQILRSGRLAQAAADVRSAEWLLDRYRPARIVADGVRHPPPRIYIELARTRNIAVDYIWHSSMTPALQKLDALTGDAHSRPLVGRCLTWGRINEEWLRATGAKQPVRRVGSPVGDHYRVATSGPSGRLGRDRNVLVLPYTPNVTDVRGLNCRRYAHFVSVIRRLKDMGHKNIRLKLHPGPGRFKKSYIEEITEFFGAECPILKAEPFKDCVAWADFVVGPLVTGAMFETLAAGKPYYAFLMTPHTMNSCFYGDFPVFASTAEFARALEAGVVPDGRALLEGLYATEEIPNSSGRFWEVLRGDFEAGR